MQFTVLNQSMDLELEIICIVNDLNNQTIDLTVHP